MDSESDFTVLTDFIGQEFGQKRSEDSLSLIQDKGSSGSIGAGGLDSSRKHSSLVPDVALGFYVDPRGEHLNTVLCAVALSRMIIGF